MRPRKVVIFTEQEAVILNFTKVSTLENIIVAVMSRIKHRGLYGISTEKVMHFAALTARPSNDINLWYMRLNHVNSKILKLLYQSTANFQKLKRNLQPCYPCFMSQSKRKSFMLNFKAV